MKKAEPRYATATATGYQQRGGMYQQQPGSYGGGESVVTSLNLNTRELQTKTLLQDLNVGCAVPVL